MVGKNKAWQKFVSNANCSSFKIVFNSYFPSLYGYGIKLCSQPELVKDSIQELFLSLWERKDELTHIESPNIYLFVSLRRKILNKLKSRKRMTIGIHEVGKNLAIQFAKEDIIIRNEAKFQSREALKEALNQLPNRQKEVIYLYFYNGMSYSEIEKILSINHQSIRNHVYRAMQTLRTLLDPKIMKLAVFFFITIQII